MLRSHLLAAGGREVPFPGPADLILVNTCAVTAPALAQSRQAVRRALRGAPGAMVVVTGCGVQLDPQTFAAIPGVGHVLGNAAKERLPALLPALLRRAGTGTPGPSSSGAAEAAAAGRGGEVGPAAAAHCAGSSPAPTPVVTPSAVDWQADPTRTRFLGRAVAAHAARTRAWLKIQDGCDQACAYCIVHRLRGRPLSRPPDEVIDEARALAGAGWREIVLTGVNLGLYGREPGAPAGAVLPALIRRLARLPGLARLRLSSLEPMTIDEALIKTLAEEPKLCPSLHLALQSADDGVLRRMGRPYRAAQMRSLLQHLAARVDGLGLGVDVIAGFPGESEAAFARTLAFLEDSPVTYLHAFAYSERPGTPAATWSEVIAPAERKERVARLRELDERLRRRFQRRLAGRQGEILLESSADGGGVGYSEAFMRVFCPGATGGTGRLLCVRLTPGPDAWHMCGQPLGEE